MPCRGRVRFPRALLTRTSFVRTRVKIGGSVNFPTPFIKWLSPSRVSKINVSNKYSTAPF